MNGDVVRIAGYSQYAAARVSGDQVASARVRAADKDIVRAIHDRDASDGGPIEGCRAVGIRTDAVALDDDVRNAEQHDAIPRPAGEEIVGNTHIRAEATFDVRIAIR